VPLCRPIDDTLQLVVPVAVPLPPRSLTHVTALTPRLSAAVPLSATAEDEVEKLAAEVGPAIATVGADVSVVAVADTDQVKDCGADVNTPSKTDAVTE